MTPSRTTVSMTRRERALKRIDSLDPEFTRAWLRRDWMAAAIEAYEAELAADLESAVRQFARILGIGLCRACNGSGFMEDGPSGATYSAPCTHCTNGVPNRVRAALRSVLEER